VYKRQGLIYEYDWCVRKNPQAQAIRTRSRELQFVGLEKDRAKTRGAIPDYLIKFVAPGENQTAINSEGQVSRNQWIDWAEAAWMDIRETRTLNVKDGRGEDDTKHICPLQLDVIDRLVRLYSNPGEIVFSPFTGIGSEGHTALKLGRRFYGCEIKDEYIKAARKNLGKVEADNTTELTLF
jgi:DNA modification methylase